MKNFVFNQLYVIQSLPVELNRIGNEKEQTGEQLYNDVLRWQEVKHPSLNVHLHKIQDRQDWNSLMDLILNDCQNNGAIPVLHFEIHGASTNDMFTNGFVLANGELIDIETIGCQLRAINIATRFNLFVTLAVCKGMSLLLNMHPEQPMPFIGAIGSFNEITESDLLLRYTEFYTEFFDSFDIAKAFIALMNANPNMKSDYRYIPADELFIRNYQRYIDEQCTSEAIRNRAKESEAILPKPLKNRAERRRFYKDFQKQEKHNRYRYYKEALGKFFQLDEFPENKERFDVPLTIEELRKRSKQLVIV